MADGKDLELHLKVERCLERLKSLVDDVGEVKRDVKTLRDSAQGMGLRVDRLEQARAASKKWTWTFVPILASLVLHAVWSRLGGK